MEILALGFLAQIITAIKPRIVEAVCLAIIQITTAVVDCFGNKGNTGNSSTGLFGSNNNKTGLFGNNGNSGSGSGLFNTNNTASNTALNSGNGSSLFGGNNQNKSGLFGGNNNNSNASTGLFGNKNNGNQSSGNMFGNKSNGGGSLFGNNNGNNKSSSLFGNSGNTSNQNNGNGFNFGQNNNQQNQGFQQGSSVIANPTDDPYQIRWKVDQKFTPTTSQVIQHKRQPTPRPIRPIVRLTPRPRRRLNKQELFLKEINPLGSQSTPERRPNPLSLKRPSTALSQSRCSPRQSQRIKLPPLPADLEKKLLENERKDGPSDKAPTCTNEKLILNPTLSEMKQMTDKELCEVRDFRVEHPEIGKVEFLKPVDLRSCAIHSTVIFKERFIKIYDSDDLPPPGTGLNQKARITLYNVFPKHKDDPERVRRYGTKLEKYCDSVNTEFLKYDHEKGIWSFEVRHF